jgi:myo-inositol-1(or 4)-monophosphatase
MPHQETTIPCESVGVAWDLPASDCIVKEAGGFCLSFPVKAEDLTKGAPMLSAGPGAVHDLRLSRGFPTPS